MLVMTDEYFSSFFFFSSSIHLFSYPRENSCWEILSCESFQPDACSWRIRLILSKECRILKDGKEMLIKQCFWFNLINEVDGRCLSFVLKKKKKKNWSHVRCWWNWLIVQIDRNYFTLRISFEKWWVRVT